MGIIGLGNIGRVLARLLSGFQVKLLGHDPYVAEDVFESLPSELTQLLINTIKLNVLNKVSV